jgi:hypothetical protein
MVLGKPLRFNGFAMKTNYIHSNNNNNRIKPTRAGGIALAIMQDAHPDMEFTFRAVRAEVSALLHKHPLLSNLGVTRKFYQKQMNEMFVG